MNTTTQRNKFINDMIELENIIIYNSVHSCKSGPIIIGLYQRLCRIFGHPDITNTITL